MNLTSVKTIKEILEKHNARPSKRLGQNFLVNEKVLEKIIESAELKKDDVVLEVGPGIGTLTQELAKRVKKVIAVEKDKKMIETLKETLENCNNVEVITEDALKLIPKSYKLEAISYKVVANIPYYLTSPLIRKFLEIKTPPEMMVLMVQKEVAQRICSKPPNMSLLAVSVQFYAEPKIISFVKKESFWPKPEVDSAIIKITPQINTDRKQINTDLFFKIVKAGFSQPRKQLINNLLKLKKDKEQVSQWLLENGINPHQRAETLHIENWISLTKSFTLVK